jgi:hypothetical protein
MARGWVHTVKRDGVWLNEVEGSVGVPWSRDEDREAAVQRGRNLAQARRAMHVIHGENGADPEQVDYTEKG